jgi:methylenetetrahydrofolate reductase (NADPH)
MLRSVSGSAATHPAVREVVIDLARVASIEVNVQDVADLDASHRYLPQAIRIYVSHLPKQTWQQTAGACEAVRQAGFEPIPHIPARLVADEAALDRRVRELVDRCGVQEILLIAGDYAQPLGIFADSTSILASGVLQRHGMRRISVAGHPEGHPQVPAEALRRAEMDKSRLAREAGLGLTFLTQFFFEPEPFVEWSCSMRARGIDARLVCGLAGPARLSTLFKFALRCGVGPSIRALGARPSSLLRLTAERGPEAIVNALALAKTQQTAPFDGIHLFCFGGFLRTCEWLHAVASGEFPKE